MVNVLVWGSSKEGPCAFFRGHMFDEPLKALGVNMRHISQAHFLTTGVMPAVGPTPTNLRQLLDAGVIKADPKDFDWADVIMFRRYYNTGIRCSQPHELCAFVTHNIDEALAHQHVCQRQDDITRILWPDFRDKWTKGMMYETDDNHLTIKPWNGYYAEVQLEQDLISEMARRADIVTVATPPLAKAYGQFNDNIRVIRNAIKPGMYRGTKGVVRDHAKPRLLYYGATVRLRDYLGYPDDRGKWQGGQAGAAVRAFHNELRSVFIGTNPGTEPIMAPHFQEQYPYVENIAKFCQVLVDSQPDIGVAPLHSDDNFDLAKSELHWLEYSMAGSATIGQRFMGGGPYSPIKSGVDGILARGEQEWRDAVKLLVRNKDAREQMAGAAKERVLAEYDYRKRAQEWADVFNWAAEHPNYQGKASVS